MDSTVITIIGIVVGFMQGIMIYLLSVIKAEITDIWKRMNNHYHEVSCARDECKSLKTGNVIIPRGGQ
jgi:hypothetical protein